MPMRVFQVIMNLLVFIFMLPLAYSGVVMSPLYLCFPSHFRWDVSCETITYIRLLLGILADECTFGAALDHVYWCSKRKLKIGQTSKICTILLFLIGLAISMYGIAAFAKRDILTYLLLKSEFVFLDYGEPIWLFCFTLFVKIVKKDSQTKGGQIMDCGYTGFLHDVWSDSL